MDPPARKAQEQRTEYRGGSSLVRDQTDRETGQQFRPWDLGPAPVLTAGSFCRATTMLNTLDEAGVDPITAPGSDGAPDPFGPETVVDVEYMPPGPTGCQPLAAPLEEASITVSSAAKNSSTAAAWRVGYKEAATAIESDPQDPDRINAGVGSVVFQSSPTPAYVVPLGDRLDDRMSGMLLETATTTVTVTGPFTKATLQEIANQLTIR